MIRYEMTKGLRIKNRGFFGVTTFDGYWWSYKYQKWIKSGESLGGAGGTTHFHYCHSVRAFSRRLREWSYYLPKGVKFILVSVYQGYNIYGST
jgi:hypothetical protein